MTDDMDKQENRSPIPNGVASKTLPDSRPVGGLECNYFPIHANALNLFLCHASHTIFSMYHNER